MLSIIGSNDVVAVRCPSSCLLPATKRKPAGLWLRGKDKKVVKTSVYNHQQGSGTSEGGKQAFHNLCRTASHPSCLSLLENMNDMIHYVLAGPLHLR